MKHFKLSLLGATTSLLLATSVVAGTDKKSPAELEDDTWATFSGTVTEVYPDSFIMDYGNDTLTVEVDDGDFDNDAYKFFKGDEVTVTGKVDDNLFTKTTLEASSIYVKGLNTTFFSSAIDEEDIKLNYYTAYVPMAVDKVTLMGRIADTSAMLDEVELVFGNTSIDVDVSRLGYNPLDDEGWLKLEEGDLIRVTGTFDEEFFSDYDLFAENIELIDS
ncbi:MAG: hypothetical protein ACPF9E_19205 [Alteromonas oceani]